MAYTRKTADIIVSHELEFILHQIKDQSEVARLLLKQRHPIENLVDNYVNYISVSNSDNTKISYLTTERIESLVNNGDDLWRSSKRFHVKPGSFVSKVFKNVPLSEVQNFSILFRNIQNKVNTHFDVLKGGDIAHYYYYGSYLSESGSLGASCMKYEQCQDYLNLYTKNSDVIKMLVMTADNSKLVGRALLWEFDDNKIMDRIYTIDDDTYQFHFKKWADDNGYIYKKEQKWNNSLFFETKGKTLYKELSVNLGHTSFENYPYLDTFKFLDTSTNTLYNYKPDVSTTNSKNIRVLCSAEGNTYGIDHLMMCEKTKLFYPYTETTYLNYCGIRVYHNICVYSDIFDTSILKEDALFDDSVNDWIFKDSDLNNEVLLESVRKKRDEMKTNGFYTQPFDYFIQEDDEDLSVTEHPF